ncbi:hypothetical protein [Burkholderia gladioli]|uniref:hypothetical protein n=1 Tax=Burkholderia gladioli TaxID=28095 RepID=UPI001641C2B2|nr:hypothetical protein [Burkholderia gladioli]MBU9426465.1 hypothetical protein [Burkholderia gladioli]MDN8063426.1 hypothetical protein [Burkholderia gladioli]
MSINRFGWLRAICLGAAGVGISLLAWTGRSPWCLLAILALPLIWARAVSRCEAALLYAGYVLAGTHDLPSILTTFFPALPRLAALGLWITAGGLLVLPWMTLWTRAMSPWQAAWRCALAIALVSLPPLGVIGWLTPIALAGQLLPGWGFAGAALTWLALASVAGVARLPASEAGLGLAALLLGLGAVTTAANATYVTPDTPTGWRSLDTRLGRYPPAADLLGRLAWHQALIDAVDGQLADRTLQVLVLPEEILGPQDPVVAASWSSIGARARARGVTVLAGVDLPRPGGGYLDALWELTAGSRVVAAARVPMPLGQWRPWRVDSSPMNLSLGQPVVVGARHVGVSFCFEDFLFWVQALTMLGQRPEVLISVANNWFDARADAQRIQERHIELWARLWGLPLIRATNWGKSQE